MKYETYYCIIDFNTFPFSMATPLTTTKPTLTVTAAKSTANIPITSQAKSWTATCDQAWCKVSTPVGAGNGAVIISYQDAVATERIAIVTVTPVDGAPVTIKVTQPAKHVL